MNLFVNKICAWAPGIEGEQDWKDWAAGKKQILLERTAPALEFTFRRRLSQISKMTVQVIHDLFAQSGTDRRTKVVFISRRGEIEREFKVNKTLIEDNEILPASFSLSTFNTPIALASIAEKLTGGYSAIYPSKGDFKQGFLAASAPVLSGAEKQIALVYADELVPDAYQGFLPEENIPLAFAMIISLQKENSSVMIDDRKISESPVIFLREILKEL